MPPWTVFGKVVKLTLCTTTPRSFMFLSPMPTSPELRSPEQRLHTTMPVNSESYGAVDGGRRLEGWVAWVDDPGFVGEHHCLGAVSRTDFGEGARCVCVPSPRSGAAEWRSRCWIGRGRGGRAPGAPGRSSGPGPRRARGRLVQSQVTFDQSPGHAWCEQRVSSGDGSYCGVQGVPGASLSRSRWHRHAVQPTRIRRGRMS